LKEHTAFLGGKRNVHNIYSRDLKERDHFEGIGLDERSSLSRS